MKVPFGMKRHLLRKHRKQLGWVNCTWNCVYNLYNINVKKLHKP